MGRPKGSKNKPKLPPHPVEPADLDGSKQNEESKSTDLDLGTGTTFFSNPIEAMRRFYSAFPDFLRDVW
jgi:hypothetical protein